LAYACTIPLGLGKPPPYITKSIVLRHFLYDLFSAHVILPPVSHTCDSIDRIPVFLSRI
jgi:hypothetical protein